MSKQPTNQWNHVHAAIKRQGFCYCLMLSAKMMTVLWQQSTVW